MFNDLSYEQLKYASIVIDVLNRSINKGYGKAKTVWSDNIYFLKNEYINEVCKRQPDYAYSNNPRNTIDSSYYGYILYIQDENFQKSFHTDNYKVWEFPYTEWNNIKNEPILNFEDFMNDIKIELNKTHLFDVVDESKFLSLLELKKRYDNKVDEMRNKYCDNFHYYLTTSYTYKYHQDELDEDIEIYTQILNDIKDDTIFQTAENYNTRYFKNSDALIKYVQVKSKATKQKYKNLIYENKDKYIKYYNYIINRLKNKGSIETYNDDYKEYEQYKNEYEQEYKKLSSMFKLDDIQNFIFVSIDEYKNYLRQKCKDNGCNDDYLIDTILNNINLEIDDNILFNKFHDKIIEMCDYILRYYNDIKTMNLLVEINLDKQYYY